MSKNMQTLLLLLAAILLAAGVVARLFMAPSGEQAGPGQAPTQGHAPATSQ
jgi:hypothetical protein